MLIDYFVTIVCYRIAHTIAFAYILSQLSCNDYKHIRILCCLFAVSISFYFSYILVFYAMVMLSPAGRQMCRKNNNKKK